MSIIALPQLTGYATAAAGHRTLVFVADDETLDNALGQATWSPFYRCHCVWLHSSLMPGGSRSRELRRVLLHECGHIRAGHISIKAKWDPWGRPRKSNPADPRGTSVLGQAMLAMREQEADEMAIAIWDSDWRIRAYHPTDLIQEKEIFP